MDLYNWFTGGEKYHYHTLLQCLDNDILTACIIVMLDFGVAIGYLIITIRWMRIRNCVPESPIKTSLNYLIMVFFFCSICGYLWAPIKMFFPVWRLIAIFLVILNIYTWKFVLCSDGFKNLFLFFETQERLIVNQKILHEKIEELNILLKTKEIG